MVLGVGFVVCVATALAPRLVADLKKQDDGIHVHISSKDGKALNTRH